MPRLDDLRSRRTEARTAADQLLTRAQDDGRDLTPDEVTQHAQHVRDERAAADELEELHANQIAELRAGAARGNGGPVLTREAADIARAFRSAIFAKSAAPIEFGTEMVDEWPDDMPEPVQGRTGRVKVHTRDTLKSTATQALTTDVYTTIVQHLVETSSLMAAGATVVTTSTGNDLTIPKSTGFVPRRSSARAHRSPSRIRRWRW